MCDKELLVAYVYDDIIDLDRARFERHLRECATCRAERRGDAQRSRRPGRMGRARADAGFRLVSGSQAVMARVVDAGAGLAAAAVLVLALASAIAQVEVGYGPNGLTVRTGWGRAAVQTAAAASDTDGHQPAAAGRAARQRRCGNARGPQPSVDAARSVGSHGGVLQASTTEARSSDAQIMRRVVDLLSQSEGRQQQELALRITQLNRDVDAQRVADLMRIQQGQGRIEAMTTAEAVAHRDLASYILTSSKQQQK